MTIINHREIKIQERIEKRALMARGYVLAPDPIYTETTHHYNGLNYVKTVNDKDNRASYTCNCCASVNTETEIKAIIDDMMLYP
jgi:hypothetical protein